MRFLALALALAAASAAAQTPVLVYHRFAPVALDTLTVSTRVFDEQLRLIAEGGHAVVPARRLVASLRKEEPALPARAVVLTADDAHVSIYTEMYPRVRARGWHVTLFVPTAAVAAAPNSLSWEQLRELAASGLFDIQSHTYWHPNFREERKTLAASAYDTLVTTQLLRSRQLLKMRLDHPVELLSWPFGIQDAELMRAAELVGYDGAFTVGRRAARPGDPVMAIPRLAVTDKHRGRTFTRLLEAR